MKLSVKFHRCSYDDLYRNVLGFFISCRSMTILTFDDPIVNVIIQPTDS